MWLSRGIVDGWRNFLEPSRGVPGAPCWLMLAHVGVMLASVGLKVPRWLKIALCWLNLAPRRPKWSPKAQKKTPKSTHNSAPGRRHPRRVGLGYTLHLTCTAPNLALHLFCLDFLAIARHQWLFQWFSLVFQWIALVFQWFSYCFPLCFLLFSICFPLLFSA